MPKLLKLVGASRYGYRGAVYEKGVVGEVADELGGYLLDQKDENGIPYFREVMKVGGGKAAAAIKAEKAKPVKVVPPPVEYAEVEVVGEDGEDSLEV